MLTPFLISAWVAAAAPAANAPGSPAAPPTPAVHWDVPLLHSAAVFAGMRVSLSVLWPEFYDPRRMREGLVNLRSAWSAPPKFDPHVPLFESDGDPWALNVVGHGLFGSEIYNRYRQCGHGSLGAFAATAITSAAWEYTVEALHQRPSAVDLVWTPVSGAVLGEVRFQLHRAAKRAGGVRPGAGSIAVMVFLDPFGELERRVFGAHC